MKNQLIKPGVLLILSICAVPLSFAETQIDLNDLNAILGSDIKPSEESDQQSDDSGNNLEQNSKPLELNDLNAILGGEMPISDGLGSNSTALPEGNSEHISGISGKDLETNEMIEYEDHDNAVINDLQALLSENNSKSGQMFYTSALNPDIEKNWQEAEMLDPEQPPIYKARIGKEDRVKVDTSKYPFRAIGRITTGSGGSCSGSLVGKRIVLTNGHCVYDRSKKKFYDNFKFHPGFQDNKSKHGVYGAANVFVSRGYMKGVDGYDWAFIILKEKAGNKVGWLGTRIFKKRWLQKNVFTLAGYPSNYTGNAFNTTQQVAHFNCLAHSLLKTSSQPMIQHICDSGQGSSGAPIYGKWKENYYVIAINFAGIGPRGVQRMESCASPKVGQCMNLAAGSYSWMPMLKFLLKKYP